MEPDVSAIFPSNVPVFRCSLPSTGSLGLVPPLLRYCEALRLPAAPPALLRFLRSAVPPLHLGLRSRGHKAQYPRARDFSPDSRNRTVRRRRQDLPGSWRTLCERAVLSDPGGTSALGHYRASVLSSANWTASTPTTNANFGAQSHGPHTGCLRFAGWITPPPRKTRFRRLANLTGRDWLPVGSKRKVSGHPILLSQALPGAPISKHRSGPEARPDCQNQTQSRGLPPTSWSDAASRFVYARKLYIGVASHPPRANVGNSFA
jgi:hypothetical protein